MGYISSRKVIPLPGYHNAPLHHSAPYMEYCHWTSPKRDAPLIHPASNGCAYDNTQKAPIEEFKPYTVCIVLKLVIPPVGFSQL